VRKGSRLVVGLWLAAGVLVVLIAVGAARGAPAHGRQQCTHGASSIGPMEIVDGQVVGGSTTPDTEACLP
jgi:hypothetical protein